MGPSAPRFFFNTKSEVSGRAPRGGHLFGRYLNEKNKKEKENGFGPPWVSYLDASGQVTYLGGVFYLAVGP